MNDNARIRIRLKSGECEVEVDAPGGTAEELTEKWWSRLIAEPRTYADRRLPQPHSSESLGREAPPAINGDTVDPVEVANQIKERDQYELIASRVLHATSRWHKVALILWACNRFLTSGEIHRVLRELGDKIDQPGVSNSLRDNQSRLQASGSRGKGKTVAYRLTSKSHKDFSEWLTSKDGSQAPV